MSASPARTFTFGRNWQRFLQGYTPLRQQNCQKALLSFLQVEDIKGKTFLDIGCGSGINSAAAWLSGAKQVFSFDYDADSVAATQQLHQNHGSPDNWTVAHGSVLDEDYMRSLGTFDIVYAWGVLHHTGDQWQALRNSILPMREKSLLYIALYAKETQYPNWQHWVDVKQRYNRAGEWQKRLMEMRYVWETILGKKGHKVFTLPKIILQYQNARGMDFMTDVRDWLGGWPTEFSSVPEVADFADHDLGLALINLRTGEANSEFLLARKNQVEALGHTPVDLAEHRFGIPVLDDVRQLPSQPVWIFGAARGGDVMFDYLSRHKVAIAGFIDLEPGVKQLHRLPVLSLNEFAQQQPKGTPVILANRYVRENSGRLHKAGFRALFNAHQLIINLHYNRSTG